MTASALTVIAAAWWQRTIGYKIMGNEVWRFLLILVVVMVAMAAGKIIQFGINTYTTRRNKKRGITVLTLFLRCLIKPISVALLALGLFVCKSFLIFDDKEAISKEAISFEVGVYWTKITKPLLHLH